MDYGAGELDYGPLDEEEDVLPSTTGAEKLAQESEFDVFIEPPEESIETTPEPEDPIRGVSSAEGRRPLWNSPADSTGKNKVGVIFLEISLLRIVQADAIAAGSSFRTDNLRNLVILTDLQSIDQSIN
jgi:hypothetical protein